MTRAGKIETAVAVAIAIAVGAVTGFVVSGEDRSHLFPPENVAAINASLDEANTLARQGNCFQALKPAGEAQTLAETLPSSVDPALKRSLIDGVVTLVLRIGNQCEENPENGTTGSTGTTDAVETEPETAATGETGTTPAKGQTGPTGKKDDQTKNKPTKPTPDPKPAPDPVEPPKTTPPETVPPVNTGPDSGGISPNP